MPGLIAAALLSSLGWAKAEPGHAPAKANPPSSASACAPGKDGILVRVHGVESSEGQIVAVLYGDNPSYFLKNGKRLARGIVPARPGTVTLCLGNPGPGTYAVAVFHDADSDLHLGRDMFGLPDEGWGLSNNPPFRMRKPKFQEAAFRAPAGVFTIDITLSY